MWRAVSGPMFSLGFMGLRWFGLVFKAFRFVGLWLWVFGAEVHGFKQINWFMVQFRVKFGIEVNAVSDVLGYLKLEFRAW